MWNQTASAAKIARKNPLKSTRESPMIESRMTSDKLFRFPEPSHEVFID